MADDFLASLTGIHMDKSVTVKDKLLADIELQKRAVKATIDGKDFDPKGSERAFSKWFFEMTDGWYSFLKAGHTAIRVKGHNGFKAGSTLEEVLAWYDRVAESIRIGALDLEIDEAVKRRTTGKRKAA